MVIKLDIWSVTDLGQQLTLPSIFTDSMETGLKDRPPSYNKVIEDYNTLPTYENAIKIE